MSITIQYLSDLHLESIQNDNLFKIIEEIVPLSKICILAGDIGWPFQLSYSIFLEAMSMRFDHIILVHGNHEYYEPGYTMQEVVDQTNNICNSFPKKNVFFLQNDTKEIYVKTVDRSILFIGTTLWSELFDGNALNNDKDLISEFSIGHFNYLHRTSRKFIEQALNCSSHYNNIIVTHHLPSYSLIDPKYKKDPISQCFASHLEPIFDRYQEQIRCWFYGHIHTPKKEKIRSVKVCCNPIGYPKENTYLDYTATETIILQ
jgi:predicted phosphohydrolase